VKSIFQIDLDKQRLQLRMGQTHYDHRHSWRSHRHRHADYELHILLEGNCRLEVEDQQLTLNKGQGVILVPGEYHQPRAYWNGFCRFTLAFSPETEALATALRQALPSSRIFSAEGALHQLCTDTFREYAAGNPYKQEQLQALLTLLMIGLLRQLSVMQPGEDSADTLTEHQRISRIDDFFEKNFTDSAGEADLAKSLHLSRRQLERVLWKNYGMNYRQKLIRARMDHAAWLLRTSSLRISQVAQQVGYNSDSAFFQVFRQHFGMTPSQYRKSKASVFGNVSIPR